MKKYYEESPKKAAIADARFKHVMAVALDPNTNYKRGLIRCIVSRVGDVAVKGFVDRSELHLVGVEEDGSFIIGERVEISNENEIIKSLCNEWSDFIGLEDPDIFIDENGLTHVYFTIPIRSTKKGEHIKIHLGHAFGKSLDSLQMTEPALLENEQFSAKELSIAPVNKQGFRFNLIESSDSINGDWYSTVQVAIAEDMGKPWKYGEVVFHPAEHKIPWIGGHASPGPLLPKSFIDVGVGKLLGIINGREANVHVGSETKYGIFSVGLFIYDYENGKIEWVSPRPFIRDSEARTITFASQFVPTGKGTGVLYAHVDDSFVREYTLRAEKIREILP